MPTPDRDTGLPEFVGWVWTHLFAAGSGRISVRMMDRATLSPEEANQLWEAYRSGSNPTAMRAIDALYRALRPVLIEFCKSKGCDAELADEITEQAFFRLMHRKPPARSGFISLIRKTAQNLLADARADARGDARKPSRSAAPAKSAEDGSTDPVASAQRSETIQAVRDCLARLQPDERAFLTFIAVNGLTQRVACEMLGWQIAPSTAHKRYYHIRDVLARCLKEKQVW